MPHCISAIRRMSSSDRRRKRSRSCSRSANGRDGNALADSRFVCLRGLPYEASTRDISHFLRGVVLRNGLNSVRFVRNRRGGVTGDCFVECRTKRDVTLALSRDRQYIGRRYVEVFKCSREEADGAIKAASKRYSHQRQPPRCQQRVNGSSSSSGAGGGGGGSGRVDRAGDCVVQLRGLPFHCCAADIVSFFKGITIASNGIGLLVDADGRCTGEAFVQLAKPEHAQRALARHRDFIGDRYIEVIPSSVADAEQAIDEQMQVNANAKATPRRARSKSRRRSLTPIVCLSPPSSAGSRSASSSSASSDRGRRRSRSRSVSCRRVGVPKSPSSSSSVNSSVPKLNDSSLKPAFDLD